MPCRPVRFSPNDMYLSTGRHRGLMKALNIRNLRITVRKRNIVKVNLHLLESPVVLFSLIKAISLAYLGVSYME